MNSTLARQIAHASGLTYVGGNIGRDDYGSPVDLTRTEATRHIERAIEGNHPEIVRDILDSLRR